MIECGLRFSSIGPFVIACLILQLRARDPELPHTDHADAKAYFLFLHHLPFFFVFTSITFPQSTEVFFFFFLLESALFIDYILVT